MMDLGDYVGGPFKDEAEFKRAYLRFCQEETPKTVRFEIENEEKTPGMPDILSISDKRAFFTELKVSDKKGVIKFEKSQPLFYKRYGGVIDIIILAWDKRFNRIIRIEPEEIVSAKSLRLKIPEKL